MAEDEKGSSAWYRVPTWDGSPATWRAFKREMSWWTSSLNLEDTKRYNLAARWLLRQSGAVRARGEEFEPSELEYQKAVVSRDPQTGEDVELTPEDPLAGLNRLLKALESLNGKTDLDVRVSCAVPSTWICAGSLVSDCQSFAPVSAHSQRN